MYIKVYQLKKLNLEGTNLGKYSILLGTIVANFNIFEYIYITKIHSHKLILLLIKIMWKIKPCNKNILVGDIKINVSPNSFTLSYSSFSESFLANFMCYRWVTDCPLIACFALIITVHAIWQHSVTTGQELVIRRQLT